MANQAEYVQAHHVVLCCPSPQPPSDPGRSPGTEPKRPPVTVAAPRYAPRQHQESLGRGCSARWWKPAEPVGRCTCGGSEVAIHNTEHGRDLPRWRKRRLQPGWPQNRPPTDQLLHHNAGQRIAQAEPANTVDIAFQPFVPLRGIECNSTWTRCKPQTWTEAIASRNQGGQRGRVGQCGYRHRNRTHRR